LPICAPTFDERAVRVGKAHVTRLIVDARAIVGLTSPLVELAKFRQAARLDPSGRNRRRYFGPVTSTV
jgi:hypothetical protein